MLLHRLRPIHSPGFPSGVEHLQRTKSVESVFSGSSYLFVSSGFEPPPPPNDICERQREKRQEIIITRCRILSFNLNNKRIIPLTDHHSLLQRKEGEKLTD